MEEKDAGREQLKSPVKECPKTMWIKPTPCPEFQISYLPGDGLPSGAESQAGKPEKPPGEGWVWNEMLGWGRQDPMDHFPYQIQVTKIEPLKPLKTLVAHLRFRYGKRAAQSK